MIRLSLAFFFKLGAVLEPLPRLKGDMKISEVWSTLFSAQNELGELLGTPWLQPSIKASAAHGVALHDALKSITDRTDFESEVGYMQAVAVTSAAEQFGTVVRSELFVVAAYYVTQKGAYDSDVLVRNVERSFPISLGIRVPEAIVDVREAGKCLAFELSTAAGFHIFRAVESVLRRYYKIVAAGKPAPKMRTLGTYLAAMKKISVGDAKVIAALDQLKDLHRNPLTHPEDILSLDEALGLFGMCQSAITAMLKQIPDPAPGALVAP